MMNAATGTGLGIRTVSGIERSILLDLGFTINAVPEPGSAILLMAGMIGSVARQWAYMHLRHFLRELITPLFF